MDQATASAPPSFVSHFWSFCPGIICLLIQAGKKPQQDAGREAGSLPPSPTRAGRCHPTAGPRPGCPTGGGRSGQEGRELPPLPLSLGLLQVLGSLRESRQKQCCQAGSQCSLSSPHHLCAGGLQSTNLHHCPSPQKKRVRTSYVPYGQPWDPGPPSTAFVLVSNSSSKPSACRKEVPPLPPSSAGLCSALEPG